MLRNINRYKYLNFNIIQIVQGMASWSVFSYDFIAVASLVRTQTQETSGGAKRRHSFLGFYIMPMYLAAQIHSLAIFWDLSGFWASSKPCYHYYLWGFLCSRAY